MVRLSVRAAWLAGLVLTAACGNPTEPDEADDALNADLRTFDSELVAPYNMHRLLEDDDLTGGKTLAAQDIQRFLEKQRSFLAGYRDPTWNRSASELIIERAQASNINPLYLLARIQIESGLVQSSTNQRLAQATGCGCPDSSGCNKSYAGFGNQVDCAAKKLRGYFTSLDTTGSTISGWRVNQRRTTSDGCAVTPKNRATAALYTYTPWVGKYGAQCGRNDIGGSSLVALVYDRFRGGQAWPGLSCHSPDVGKAVPVGACVRSAADRLLRQCTDSSWTTVADNSTCASPSYPFCYSGTLGQRVPVRTCVQARSNRQWQQCAAEGRWVPAPDARGAGKGPLGACTAVYQL